MKTDMDIGFEELAMLFALKGWLYATDDWCGVPTAEALQTHIASMVTSMETAQRAGASRDLYHPSGRFIVFSDSDMPSSFQVALLVGHVDRQEVPA